MVNNKDIFLSIMFLYRFKNSQKAPLSLKLSFKNVSPHFFDGHIPNSITTDLLTKFLLTRDCGDMKFPLCLVYFKKMAKLRKIKGGNNQPTLSVVAMSCVI